MGQFQSQSYSKYDLTDFNLDLTERRILQMSNHRWVECKDPNDPFYG